MLNKYQKEWANCIVKTEENELLLVDKQKHIQLETFGQNKTTANSGLAKDGLTSFVETFVQGSTFVLRINFSAKNPALRQAAKRHN